MITVTVTGRIVPNTANSDKNYVYTPATGDPANGGKSSWLHFLMSVQQEGAAKDPATGYYPTFLLPCKAFGPTADQINQYAGPGSRFGCVGVLLKDKPYTGNDGVEHEGKLYLKAQKIIYDCLSKKEDADNGTYYANKNTYTQTAPAPATATGGLKVNYRQTNASTLRRPAAANNDPF